MKIAGIIGAILVAIVVFVGFNAYGAWKTGNQLENALIAEYDKSRNVLAQYGQKITEIAQIPAMYRDDVSKVAVDAINARYGEEGSKALFQAIAEQNPNLDSAVYVQIQREIAAGRNDFQNAQNRVIDVKRTYVTALGSPWKGTWMKLVGYPTVELSKFDIVSSVRAEDAFDKKIEEPIKLR